MDPERAREDMEMIRRMMEESRRVVTTGRHHYVAWGTLITAALLLTWTAATGRTSLPVGWVWAGAVALGWAFSAWAVVRWDRRAPVSNLAGRTMGGLWIGTGVCLTLVGFLGPASGQMGGSALLGTIAAVLGATTLATAAIQGSTRTGAIAAGWWVGSAVLFLWPGRHALLVAAALMVVLHLLPGLLLFRGRRPATEPEAPAGAGGAA